MGLVHFNELFNHDNLLGNAKVPFDKPEGAEILKTITQSTSVMFVDLTFLLTSGRDMKFATPDAFVTDRSDKDLLERQKAKPKDVEETEDQEEPKSNLNGSYPPMSIDDLVEYLYAFIQNMINTRPLLTTIVFGTDNHVHVPVTKLREWHYRDYHKNSTYETYDGTLRHELRGPFSRTDEGLISNLLNLLEEKDTESFKQQILGLTFTRADPMLDAFLTDRYIRPFFISLLFERFFSAETTVNLPANKSLKVFVMHAIYNFSAFCNSDEIKFHPNMCTYSNIDKKTNKKYDTTDDGLHIGEADLQFLWMLDTKLAIKQNPPFVELLSNDSDMFLIMMNYYYKNSKNILGCPYVFIWLSDTRLIRTKHMFTTAIPSMMKNFKLPDVITSSLFIELCLCFFKNDYVDSPSGLVASIPKFKATLAALGDLFEELRKRNNQDVLKRNAISYKIQNGATEIVLDHFKLMQLRQILMLIGMNLVTKKEDQMFKQALENTIKKVLTVKTIKDLVVATEGILTATWIQFINKLKMPASIKTNLISKGLEDTIDNIIYPLQMTHSLQSLCAQYLDNNQNFDIFGKDSANFEYIEPSTSNIWFMSVSDDYGCKGNNIHRGESMINRHVNNPNDDRTVAFIDVNEQDDLEDDDDGANEIHETCSKMKKIQETINSTKMLFPGELHPVSLSAFAAMTEWIVVYWNFGYYECFSKQMRVGVDVNTDVKNINQDMTIENTADTDNTQMWRLLRLAHYKMTTLQCEGATAQICQLKRDTAIKNISHIKREITKVVVSARKGDKDAYAFVKDQSTVLRRSGMLFIKPIGDSILTTQLSRLAKVCLFRLITLTNTQPMWINQYAEQYERLKYEFTIKKGQTQENTEVYPDEHLVLKIAIARLTTENNLIEPACNYIKTLKIQGKDKPGTTVLFTPTCVTSNMDNTVDLAGSEIYRTRDKIDEAIFRIDVGSTGGKQEDAFMGERDIIGELDTCAFTGVILSTQTVPTDKSIEDAAAATAFGAHINLGFSHPFTGTRVVSSLQTIMATTGQNVTMREFIEANKYVMKQRVADELANSRLLSCSVDVTDYALPLLKLRIDDDSWRDSTSNILKVFREPMQTSFFTFMDWKCNQSIYLRFLLKQNIRNNKTQKWRDNLFLVPAFFQQPSNSFVPINSVAKLSDITKGKTKYWGCFPMAFIDCQGKMKAVTNANSADFVYLVNEMNMKTNHPLRLLSDYMPLGHGIYVNIKQNTETASDTEDESFTVSLFFKKIPEHIFVHYIYYTFVRLYEEYMSLILQTLQRQPPNFSQFITNPYMLVYKPTYQENEEKVLQRYSFEFYYYY
jgi:hypothetical protein